jgi:hypothetical protein
MINISRNIDSCATVNVYHLTGNHFLTAVKLLFLFSEAVQKTDECHYHPSSCSWWHSLWMNPDCNKNSFHFNHNTNKAIYHNQVQLYSISYEYAINESYYFLHVLHMQHNINDWHFTQTSSGRWVTVWLINFPGNLAMIANIGDGWLALANRPVFTKNVCFHSMQLLTLFF